MVVATTDVWPNTAGFDTDYQEHEPVELTVKGEIPRYAAGVLYRTGPLGYKAKTDDGKIWSAKHWFDGFSCVHRFQIDFPAANGPPKVTYRSRRTVDEYIETVRKTGKLDSVTFAAKRDPCNSFFSKVMAFFQSAPNERNIGVTLSINMPGGHKIGGTEKSGINGHTNGLQTLHVKTDSANIKQIDPETLEPTGFASQASLHPELKGPFSAAHAKSDPKNGDMYNFNLDFGYKSTYRLFRVSASTGETDILATFNGMPAYIHSLFLTENYVILCVWSSHISWSGLSLMWHKNIIDSISPFDPNSKSTWYVVDRVHGKGLVATYESIPFFCFHSINAWEQPSPSDPSKTDIITELSMFENLDVVKRFYYDSIISSIDTPEFTGENRMSSLPMQAQFRLPSVDAGVPTATPMPAELLFQAEKFDSMELPTCNPAYITRQHRYTYGCADRLKSTFFDGLVKFDNQTKKSIFWEEEGHTPGEAIFVADPEGTEEDDGVLLSVVLDGHKEKSYLLVLKAKDLTEVGRAYMQGPMSFGFHGTFMEREKGYRGDV
ncbi:Lignostilbene-alphabeta-dioxygenase [Pyrenophora tritici-repentis]|uniref:Beta,beta-carotene 9',10'-dioxygenase n=2 Tax=Pyrenophora tritici-repentis TaxID=45151 RepID=A0A2W1FXM4_9PLEO|nr:beta,beta-carotene 9',10'-dioxygenase [Pyrenophora tritici-repentis Pt-1C-BFP]KAA8621248.1 Beta beta-carotene 9 10-dioxygenase [Pyrenophora tritici-repentis]EDU43634.1 beta,beta-carotene 9',10'-dioxygenase [Pyrenophora tritici-repentis Pt-1C-BFP]KAF7450484.1 Beta-beta-carotene 9'-10'-dioxygenase [Pyrenophora tritici-repentis]KAF7573100.1 Lignostilbene-alpha,beta-dioxygenase [Pyrenophora tritici-repentis]KAG9381291.1 Beta,beta-carotene 9',10'-dioxygenase [Pyrenophora tritici-repentis]